MGNKAPFSVWLAASAFALFGCAVLRGPRRPLGPDRAQPSREYLDRGDYQTAARLANELLVKERLTSNEQQRAYWTLTQSYELLGRLDKALSAYQVAVQLYPRNKGLTLGLAKLLHRTQLDTQARTYFERVLDMDPRNGEAHLGLAESFRTLGLLDESASHYRIALEGRVPDPAGAWLDYARTLAEKMDWTGAEAAVGKAIELSPRADNLAFQAAIRRRLGRGADAYASLEAALRLEPRRRDLLLRKAFWLLKDGRLEEAQAQARELPAEDPLASFVLAAAALKRGDRKAAAACLGAAEKGGPFVAETAQDLLAIEKHPGK